MASDEEGRRSVHEQRALKPLDRLESPFFEEPFLFEEDESAPDQGVPASPYTRAFENTVILGSEADGSSAVEDWSPEPTWESETQEGLAKKLQSLSFFPHAVERDGDEAALTPGVMDPGIYDGPVKYKIASKLQECLMRAIRARKDFAEVKVALVDLTKGDNQPELAAYNHKTQVFAASVPKIAAMLGAFQLRQDLRSALQVKKPSSLAKLYELIRDDWAATQAGAPPAQDTALSPGISLRGKLVLVRGNRIGLMDPRSPRLESIFANAPSGGPLAVEFASTGEDKERLETLIGEFKAGKAGARAKIESLGFLERLRVMIGGLVPASNFATSTIIRDTGFPYIASTLLQSGLYNTHRNGGLWLGSDFWGTTWRGAPGGGPAQSATAGALAAFMTLLVRNRLVAPQASKDMLALLKKEVNLTHPVTKSSFREGLKRLPDEGRIRTAFSKMGSLDGEDDCAFIDRKVAVNGGDRILRYVAVGLRARNAGVLSDLILELDKCILANNGLTAIQGGHSQGEMERLHEDPSPAGAEASEMVGQEMGYSASESNVGEADLGSGEASEKPSAWLVGEEAPEPLFEREWEPQKEKVKVKVKVKDTNTEKEEVVEKVIFEKAVFKTPDQDEAAPISVEAFRFKGASEQVALIFAGVHGSEPQGVVVAKRIMEELKKAARGGKRPQFTTIIIPELIKSRRSTNVRYVKVKGKDIEPNRNFPLPGENYAAVKARGQSRSDGAELLDSCKRPLAGPLVTHRMLAENRILIQLIEREKPGRATSIHAHSVPGRRGDGPGIFVDPRGDFDPCTDQSTTPLGKSDDQLTVTLIDAARAKLTLPLKNNSQQTLPHPLHGNLADHFTNKVPSAPSLTVHYTSTSHPAGTSFGMWAPSVGLTTVTMELPQYPNAGKALDALSAVYTQVLIEKFLGGLAGP